MIQITPQMRVVVAVEPADFRRGIDGLARLCRDVLGHDPLSGWVFVFRNRRGGWHNCPSRSIPAAEIERFVVDQIKAVARDPGLVAETLAQARQQIEESLRTLEAERQSIDRDLIAANKEIREVAIEAANADDDSPATRRLADLQERVQSGERRLTEIREEALRLRAEFVGEQDVARAMHEFDPLWEALSPREQARVLHLLIERVDYDGEDGTVSVTFRPSGIRELARLEEETA